MPAGLQDALALPGGHLQARRPSSYTLYHITDPVQFFNKQAIWDIAPTPAASTVTAPVVAAVDERAEQRRRNTTLPASTARSTPLYLTMQFR